MIVKAFFVVLSWLLLSSFNTPGPSYHQGFTRSASESAYPQLWRGLVGVWVPSLGPTGTSLFDWGGTKQTGTLISMAPSSDWVLSVDSRVPGYALDFDGIGDEVDTGNTGFLTRFTLIAWVNPTSFTSSNYHHIISRGSLTGENSSNYTFGYRHRASNNTDRIFIGYRQSGGTLYWNEKELTADPIGAWHHIVGIYDGSDFIVYQDGIVVPTAAASGGTDPAADPDNDGGQSTTLGLPQTVGSESIGYIGEASYFAIYDRALTAAEVLLDYNTPLALLRPAPRLLVKAPAVVVTAPPMRSIIGVGTTIREPTLLERFFGWLWNFILPEAHAVVAFPGAEGFGKDATGGRGGAVCQVTNTDNSGSGSFRECVEVETGTRTVVFTVGGTIDGSVGGDINITSGNITIAGQTAPGDGILIKGAGLVIEAAHVIIRHIRIRPGLSIGSKSPSSSDALQLIGGASNVIIDHVSMSWAQDEVWSIFGSVDTVTLQNSIVTEPLHCADHSEGCHGKCIIIGFNADDITVHHNLLSHCPDRTPEHKGGTLDWVNNVIYHYTGKTSNWTTVDQVSDINLVGNRYDQTHVGNDTNTPIRLNRNSTNQLTAYLGEVDASGNIDNIFRSSDSSPVTDNHRLAGSGSLDPIITGTRFAYPQVTTTTAAQALIDVATDAGANQCMDSNGNLVTCFDSIDTQIIVNLNTGVGSIICGTGPAPNCTDGVDFTYPTMNSGTAYTDADADGMADTWETTHGVDDGTADPDGDGYTNLEEFLNGTVPVQGTSPPPATAGWGPGTWGATPGQSGSWGSPRWQ